MNFRPHVGVNLWLSHIASHLLPIDLCILCTAKKGSCCWPAYKVTGKIHRRKYPRNLGLRDRGSAAIVQVHINGEQDNCAAGRNLPQSTPWKLKVELWKNKEHPLPTPSVGVASVCLFLGRNDAVAWNRKFQVDTRRSMRCLIYLWRICLLIQIVRSRACWNRCTQTWASLALRGVRFLASGKFQPGNAKTRFAQGNLLIKLLGVFLLASYASLPESKRIRPQ